MIINLIMKRISTDGKVEMKIVPTLINGMEESEGWSVASWAHSIEFVDPAVSTSIKRDPCVPILDNLPSEQLTENSCATKVSVSTDMVTSTEVTAKVEKAIADHKKAPIKVTANSKLVRIKDKIFIARIRPSDKMGKNTIFISDCTRTEFFRSVQEIFGSSTQEYRISNCYHQFKYWDNFMNDTYKKYQEGTYIVS